MNKSRCRYPNDPRWRHFPDTILEFPDCAGLRVDLRKDLDPALVDRLNTASAGSSLAVVTACNPAGRRLSEAENSQRTAALRDELEKKPLRFVRADGLSIDGKHRERGFACAADETTALSVARRWEQLAIFFFDGSRFCIVPTSSNDGPRVRFPLPLVSPRWPSQPPLWRTILKPTPPRLQLREL